MIQTSIKYLIDFFCFYQAYLFGQCMRRLFLKKTHIYVFTQPLSVNRMCHKVQFVRGMCIYLTSPHKQDVTQDQSCRSICIHPTPPNEQNVTQGQFVRGMCIHLTPPSEQDVTQGQTLGGICIHPTPLREQDVTQRLIF